MLNDFTKYRSINCIFITLIGSGSFLDSLPFLFCIMHKYTIFLLTNLFQRTLYTVSYSILTTLLISEHSAYIYITRLSYIKILYCINIQQ